VRTKGFHLGIPRIPSIPQDSQGTKFLDYIDLQSSSISFLFLPQKTGTIINKYTCGWGGDC
jgi:hypothetical protein